MSRTIKEIEEYVLSQSNDEFNIISIKPEREFDDLGIVVKVWNVKTDGVEDIWVVEGNEMPMNLYTQKEFFFSTDEVYSFHIGIITRMQSKDTFKPDQFIDAVSLNKDIAAVLYRKLKNVVALLDTSKEVEDFQSIGVQCREILIELTNDLYKEYMCEGEQPQSANFKSKTDYYVKFYLSGSDNSDYRRHIKKITDATWDYANKITHSRSATFYEASKCVTLCTALISVYENIRQKVMDPLSQYQCKNCKSKKLNLIGDESNMEGVVKTLILKCDDCDSITKIEFEDILQNETKYITWK